MKDQIGAVLYCSHHKEPEQAKNKDEVIRRNLDRFTFQLLYFVHFLPSGDADRCDIWGRSALHLAAGNGYLVCVGFLTNVGANIWAMDNERRTPLELASLKGQVECVQLLDKMAGEQTEKDPRQTQHAREKASKVGYLDPISTLLSFLFTMPFSYRPPDSVLVRPGVGNMVFRHCYVPPSLFEAEHGGMVPASAALTLGKDRSTLAEVIGMAKEEEVEVSDGSPPWNEEGLGLQDDEAETQPLESFLASLSLQESLGACCQQRLDMEALVMCDEDDLRAVGLPVGTRKKVLVAIEKRRQDLAQPGPLRDTQL
uniref:Ankyrin repeat and sterile alpha motif domain containing 4B n=1 Tax=Eptatretus burgeri TaxID=7764 RepID=A0A8C4X0X9_EPTBU